MKKRILAIVICALMAFQVAGCGNNKKDTKNNNKNKVESTENSKKDKEKEDKKENLKEEDDNAEINDNINNNTDSNNENDVSNTYTDNDNDGKLDISDLYGEWSVEGVGFRSNVYAMTDEVLNTYVGNSIIISDNECLVFDKDYTNVTYELSTMTVTEFDNYYNTKIENTNYGNKDITIIKIIKDSKSQGELIAYDRNTIFYYLDGVALKLNRI